MYNPTTGSPTITLFQLRPNYYSVYNILKIHTFIYKYINYKSLYYALKKIFPTKTTFRA